MLILAVESYAVMMCTGPMTVPNLVEEVAVAVILVMIVAIVVVAVNENVKVIHSEK